MLRFLLLALVGIFVTHGQRQLQVSIEFQAPFLRLSLATTDSDITGVVFHFGDRASANAAKGSQTKEGWEYRTEIKGGTTIYAYAELYYSSGLIVTTPRATHNTGVVAVRPNGRRLRAVIFRDEFTSFSKNDWTEEVSMFGGMNWEFEVYTNDPKNVYAQGGKLFLHPTLTTDDPRFDENFLKTGTMDMTQLFGVCTNSGDYGCSRDGHNGMLPPIMSGKVSSEATLKFGTVEVKAKIPKGDWLWPAIWMMPKKSVYGGWPRSGEMDIMESRGNDGALGVGTVTSTLHWGPAWNINKWDLTHGEITSPTGSFHDDFHVWRLDWTTDGVKTYVDDKLILSADPGTSFWNKGGFTGDNIWASGTKMAPFDQDFYVIFNVAVGGTNGYFSDTANWGVKKPWPNNSPHANLDFWNAKNDWLPTWKGDEVALQIEYVELRN